MNNHPFAGQPANGAGPEGTQYCYRHPGTPAYVRCQRCGRPICPACQIPAAVGVQCPECVQQANRTAPAARSILGAPISRGHLPLLTIGALVLCVIGYVAQLATGGANSGTVTQHLVFAPIMAREEPWRLITSAFLHGSPLHLLFNGYALWVVGSFVERLLGRWRFAALFLLSAIGGNVAVLVWARIVNTWGSWLQGTLGASGAVFGLFATTLILSRRLGGNMSGILSVIAINLVFSFTVPNVSWQGHIGGLLLGGALAALFVYTPRLKRFRYSVAGVVGAVVLCAGLVIGLTASLY
ncbi:MAG: rhomboid family intramembrane serine protease [Bifidobacteriaceae bacterium]|nr:rhomboid family intramembrane serine protease [Bifidobacteriaceae bacterium]